MAGADGAAEVGGGVGEGAGGSAFGSLPQEVRTSAARARASQRRCRARPMTALDSSRDSRDSESTTPIPLALHPPTNLWTDARSLPPVSTAPAGLRRFLADTR